MKKIALALLLLAGATISGMARDEYARDASALPAPAQSSLKSNFKAGVSVVKIDKEFGRVSEYDVVLTDGTEISFDSKGNWKDVEVAANKSVPSGYVLQPIRDYVKKVHSGTRIVGIEKSRSGYEVELSNGIDMKFNLSGDFVKYD